MNMDIITIQKCKVTQIGMTFDPGLSYEEWSNIGQQLQIMHKSIGFWIGDWLNFGERKYGEKYTQAIEENGLDYGTLRNYNWVTSQIELSRRRDNVSFSSHSEVASLEPKQQNKLLDKAEKENLTSREVRELVKELKKLPTPPLPEGRYQVIYADPCWPYNERKDEKNLYGNANYHYPTMSIEELKKLPIKELKTGNSVLFMWVATNFLEESFELLKEWNMEYKSQMIWHKYGGQGGIGWYCWGDHEILLIATSGSFLPDKLFSSVYQSPRERHSKKPDYYYEMIETIYPKCKYLEMFARNENKRTSWTYWGNEAKT